MLATLLWCCVTDTASGQESYSPYAEQTFPDRVYWGDTHVHSALSGDAFAMGARLMPDAAYRFARGETVRATSGHKVRLRRPLDFLMIADHAENLGVLPRLVAQDGSVPRTETARRWAEVLGNLEPMSEVVKAESRESFERRIKRLADAKRAQSATYDVDASFRRSVWDEVIANAERFNDPGRFTTFIGYEWSARDQGPMIHRNVLFAGDASEASQVLPFSRFDSDDPEDLWAYLQDFEDRTGGQAIAIPHNGNLSRGKMFRLSTFGGQPLTEAYAQRRSRWEPIYEVTQIKGDGETHPAVSQNDEFADFETWAVAGRGGASKEVYQGSFARSALLNGLAQQAELGVNPFKFGLIGSTDSHTALATADENNFWGKMSMNEPSPYRGGSQAIFSAAGYAAVWAQENTRQSLFAAMKRREVYATTGPRITVRFFGGWEFESPDATRPDLAAIGYRKGVPMGGDLAHGPQGASPKFLVRAVKDPDGAHLDRIQIIKGHRDQEGRVHEQVFDVCLSDQRAVGPDGKAEPVGSTVDLENATYNNSIGDPEMSTVWTDPDFDPDQLAFYYVRVLEIPTPRWTAYDWAFYGVRFETDDTAMIVQDRAYTSPIWYSP